MKKISASKSSSGKRKIAPCSPTLAKGKEEAKGAAECAGSQKKTKTESSLQLEELFSGSHGDSWKPVLTEALEHASNAPAFVGPNRSPDIMPLRELTFQALKPNPPVDWNVIVFGQNPYPRVESATGIAMFDNNIDSWDSPVFAKTVSMRILSPLPSGFSLNSYKIYFF